MSSTLLRQNEATPSTRRSAEEAPTIVKRASLALPSSLFPSQSRPTPLTTVITTTTTPNTTTGRSEPFAPVDAETQTLHKSASPELESSPLLIQKKKKKFSIRLPPRFRKSRRSKNNTMSNGIMNHGGGPENVLQWLEAECPNDVVPKVLAFCGPHMTETLMSTNRYWFQLIAQNDSTWRHLCQGMYKWREGEEEPTCWKEYYRLRPCVPVDYPTIPRALAVATAKKPESIGGNSSYSQYIRSTSSNKKEQIRSVEILLRPGKHYVKECLSVAALEGVTVTMSTMKLPENRFYSPRLAYAEQEHAQSYPEPKSKARNSSFRQLLMGCKSIDSAVDETTNSQHESTDLQHFYDSDSSEHSTILYQNRTRTGSLSDADARRIQMLSTYSVTPPPKYPTRATLVLRTRRQNEPVIRVKQGVFSLSGVDLEHASQGVDIWNGNAAVQVQPPLGPDNEPMEVSPRPSAHLTNVSISSKSGRGLVCLDGGTVALKDCMIFDCAATGLYVGGPGSEADISLTDVIRNGIGSRLPPSRAPRVTSGHSGVYLEQGLARITECNISSNYLTGISAISFDRAFLHLTNSDLVANGQGNLEMPPPGTVSYDKSDIANDNNMASVGRPCLRSNLELPTRIRTRASATF